MTYLTRSRAGFFLLVVLAGLSVAASSAGAQPAGCDIVGTAGDDVLVGTDAGETICGLGGDDVIDGGGGDDLLLGGAGNDVLRGGEGRDVLLGGGGHDDLNGQRGADRLNGQRGADVLQGGPGRDRLLGGAGVDTCADLAGRTRTRSCETGPLLLERALDRWTAAGMTEYVYARSVAEECEEGFACTAVLTGPDVVHVRDGIAVGERADTVARTAEELFDEAVATLLVGGRAYFDPVTGFPSLIDVAGVGTVYLSDLERRDDVRAAHDEAVRNWAVSGFEDYSFEFRHICFCPGIVSVRVEVKAGEIVAETPVDEPADGDAAWVPDAQTVVQHLTRIGELLDGLFISVNADFDPATGVPTSYGFDQSRLIADEELSVVIDNFTPVPFTIDDPQPGALAIVTVQGIEVNREIAESLDGLLDAAAADGFNFSGGGFRDPAAQIALRRANCGTSEYAIWEMPASQCSPPTARPGQSLHETGHAVDFTNDGSLITSRATASFAWLEANAAAFGFFNHPAEPWHWSINGN